nr:MAG TPA: minor capsid protein [Caudoviricetes sp.]
MLDPEYLRDVAEGAEEIAAELHDYILQKIVSRIIARIGKGKDYLLTATDRWNIETMQEAGYLLEEITAEIARATKMQTAKIAEAMEEAGVKALGYDDKVYQDAGLSPEPLEQSPSLVRLMERNMRATLGEWSNFTRTTAQTAQSAYINACDMAHLKIMTGATSYTQAVREAVEEAIDSGAVVTYPTGHKDTLETATARAVRTGIAQATGDISIKRMEEMDWDIILVSAHVGARTGDGGQNPSNHLWWQGQYYSRTGRDKRFPDFKESTGYGTGEGLCGWNCRHSFGSGTGKPEDNPYKEINQADNYKAEQAQKQQRLLERRIRSTKRAVMALQDAVDSTKDDAARFELQQLLERKSYLLERQSTAYSQYCKDNKLKPRNERLQLAKWQREQARKARADAKLYKDAKGIS